MNILRGERQKWNRANYLSSKRQEKALSMEGEWWGGEREKVKFTLITFDFRREQHAHSIRYENLPYTTGK